MTIEFGNIKSYNADRGFGFVGRTVSNPDGQVFFHIKRIKKKHPELAQKLDNSEVVFETVNFWYEIETNEKGQQVSKLWLGTKDIPECYRHELCSLVQKVKTIWKNVDSAKPSWLDCVTIELLGVDRRDELSVERDNLESQLREAEEERRRQEEALRQSEIRRIAKVHNRNKEEADELERLLAEMRPLGFTHSNQLSAYIVRNKLGYKYQHISGILRMRNSYREWDFHGGFPPGIYYIICRELNLDNQRTDAEPGDFTPFKDIC